MKNKQIIYISVLLLFVMSSPSTCWALQSHGAPEGNYVHQMAHLLFMGSLCYLYWHTRRTQDLASKGWKYLQVFCFVFTCWNLVALIGHEAFDLLSPTDFIEKNSWQEQIAAPITPVKVVYFLTKMDHLLYVPGLLALVISLKTFYMDAILEEER